MRGDTYLKKYKKGWKIKEVDVESKYGYFINGIYYPTLEEAVRMANAFMEEHPVEYGLDVQLD